MTWFEAFSRREGTYTQGPDSRKKTIFNSVSEIPTASKVFFVPVKKIPIMMQFKSHSVRQGPKAAILRFLHIRKERPLWRSE